MAAAAITPRESDTASSPLRFPGVSFIRNSSAYELEKCLTQRKSYHDSRKSIGGHVLTCRWRNFAAPPRAYKNCRRDAAPQSLDLFRGGWQEEEAVLARGCFDVSVKMIKQFRSFCGYKCKQTERPLLQRVIREQPISNLVVMSIQDAGAKAFGAAGFRAQAIPLKM